MAAGETQKINGGRAGLTETVWITLSHLDADQFGATVPFELGEARAEATSDEFTTRYVFVLDGGLCEVIPS